MQGEFEIKSTRIMIKGPRQCIFVDYDHKKGSWRILNGNEGFIMAMPNAKAFELAEIAELFRAASLVMENINQNGGRPRNLNAFIAEHIKSEIYIHEN